MVWNTANYSTAYSRSFRSIFAQGNTCNTSFTNNFSSAFNNSCSRNGNIGRVSADLRYIGRHTDGCSICTGIQVGICSICRDRNIRTTGGHRHTIASRHISTSSIKDRSVIECSTAFAAGHLVPLAAIRSGNNTVRNIRLFKLCSTVHIHSRLFSIGRDRRCTDMSTGDLRALQLEALHLRHIVAQTAVRNVAGNGTGCIGCTGCHRSDGIAVQGCAVSSCDTTEGTRHKTGATTEAHPLTALYDCITDIRVRTESGSKALCKTCSCSTCSGCRATGSAEHTSCATSHTAANTGDHPGCHQ